MSEPETASGVLSQIPWARLVGVAVITAVAVTFAQKLLFGEANVAVTAGITGALTATLGLRRQPAPAAPSDAES